MRQVWKKKIKSANIKVEIAQVAEWSIAIDCKSIALTGYGGSNPPLRITTEVVFISEILTIH